MVREKKKSDRILPSCFIAGGGGGCCIVVTCDGMTHTEEVFCSSFFLCINMFRCKLGCF